VAAVVWGGLGVWGLGWLLGPGFGLWGLGFRGGEHLGAVQCWDVDALRVCYATRRAVPTPPV